MTREQWSARMVSILEAMRSEVKIYVVEKKTVHAGAYKGRITVGGMNVTLLYGYDLHAGREDQFWVDFLWAGDNDTIDMHVLSENDLMRDSHVVALEVLDAMTT